MPNKSTNPDATMMIVVDEKDPSTDPKTYQYVYVGNINDLPSDVLTESSIIDNLTTERNDRPLSANQGRTLNSHVNYVTCGSGADYEVKLISDDGFELSTHLRLLVKMTNTNTHETPKLNINNTGAFTVWYNGSVASDTNTWSAGEVLDVYYDGTNERYIANTHSGAQFSTGEKVGDVGIDDEPTAGSESLVKSGGVKSAINQNVLQHHLVRKTIETVTLGNGGTFKILNTDEVSGRVVCFKFNSDDHVTSLRLRKSPSTDILSRLVQGVSYFIRLSDSGNYILWNTSDSTVVITVEILIYDCISNDELILKSLENEINHLNGNSIESEGYVYSSYALPFITGFKIKAGEKYKVKISCDTNFTRLKLGTNSAQDNSDTHDNLVNNTEYTYTAVNDIDIFYIRILAGSATGYNYGLVNFKLTFENQLENYVNQQIGDMPNRINAISEVVQISSKNLFNPNDPDVEIGKYLSNDTGRLSNNSEYSTTGFIPVTAGNTYWLGYVGATEHAISARFVLFYNSAKEAISSSYTSYTQEMVAPENAAFLRITLYTDVFFNDQVTEGQLYPYEDYFEPYQKTIIQDDKVETSSIKDKSIEDSKLSDKLNGKVNSKLGRFVNTGEVAQDNYLLLPNIHIGKNNFLSCSIDGNITDIEFGVGYANSSEYLYRDYQALWVKIDTTYVTQYRYNNGSSYVQVSQVEHGMTFTNKTKVEMANLLSNSYVKIYDDLGNVFKTSIQDNGMGRPFIKNNGSTTITCVISDFPMDLNKPIWLFGDSYISFADSARWTYYLLQEGYVNWLSNNQPGLSPATAWTNLQNLLSLGKVPKTLIWLLGMNGSVSESQSGGQYVINSYQKTYIDNVVNICNSKGIELVIGVVPTVPSRQKTGFGNYVKSLGVRYIDFAYAVGTNSSGQWNTGLLSYDDVHPTEAGAKVLASQALVDCPELAITD